MDSNKKRGATWYLAGTLMACAASALVACAATVYVAYKYATHRVPRPSVPAMFLREAFPIAVHIEWQPDLEIIEFSSTNLKGTTQARGPARFQFKNRSEVPVKLAFPPVRVFGFSKERFSPEAKIPKFAVDSRVITLEPGESASFDGWREGTFLGAGSFEDYAKGGAGFIGFVFAPPQGESTTEYCTGTAFPTYSVTPSGKITRWIDDGSRKPR